MTNNDTGYMQDTPELFFAGTQLSPEVDYSTLRFEQDVNQNVLGESFDSQSNDFYTTNFDPFANHIMANPSIENIQPIRRTDSGLNARARPFIPAAQQTGRICNTTIPARTQQLLQQQLTPIRTNFDTCQTPPYSAPSFHRQDAFPTDISPMLTITDALERTQIHPSHGYQWPLDVAPAQQIDTWVGSSYGSAQLDATSIDPTYLTPITPGSHYSSGSTRSRSHSTASASSFHCEHAGCGKEFKTRTEISHHRRNHGERNHACMQCDKRFVFRKDLNRHMKTHNPDQREYFCPYKDCQWAERGFQRRDHFGRHMKTHMTPRSTGMQTPLTASAPMSRCASSS